MHFLEATQSAAWQWAITIDEDWIAGVAVQPDAIGPRRAWISAYASARLSSGFQIRPLIDRFEDLKRLGPYDEIRAWILDGEPREERFAQRFGLRLDCGPATGFSPTGRNMNLWRWSRQ